MMVKVRVADPVPSALLALIVAVDVPASSGYPVIAPVEASMPNPGGKVVEP